MMGPPAMSTNPKGKILSAAGTVMDSDNESETEENENQHVTHLRDP